MQNHRWLLALLCLLISGVGICQTNVGRISGVVYDPSGAPVPGCMVTAVNMQTGLRKGIRTEAGGYYVLTALPAGSYVLTAEQAGFSMSEQSDVKLDAASQRSIDFHLQVGAVTESVKVTAPAERVQTTSGDIGRVINDQQLSQIALNGRNYVQLLRLVPGAVSINQDPFSLAARVDQQKINGIRSNSSYFTLDGASNLDTGASTNSLINPSVDAIAEVRILTSSYSAEFGHLAGAQINVVTKSGTREFHGTMFEFVRNGQLFDARSFFSPRASPLHFNDFGWTLGGPIVVPGRWNTDRNRLFFFASQEWKYNHEGTTVLNFVPTPGERTGDFRNSTLAAPIDPSTGAAFPNRIVPASRFSRNGPALLNVYPTPNSSIAGGNHVVTDVTKTDTRGDILRLDYNLSSATQVMYRWTHDTWDNWNPFLSSNLGIAPGGQRRPGYVTTLSLAHTFSPTTVSSTSVSASGDKIWLAADLTPLQRSTLGLTIPEVYSANREGLAPRVTISGFTGWSGGPQSNNNLTLQLREDFTKILGTHTLKFGGELWHSRKNGHSNAVDQGQVTFNTSAQRTSRNTIADVLLGNFYTWTEDQEDLSYWARLTQAEFYAQDSWKVNRNLSLEFGLRYNIIAPIYDALGGGSSFLPSLYNLAKAPKINTSDGSIVPGTGDPYNGLVLFGNDFPSAAKGRLPIAADPAVKRLFIGLPRSGMETTYHDFGPRFGFAWDPSAKGRSVLRGGFGMFYDQLNQGIGGTANPPASVSASIYNGSIDNPPGGTNTTFPAALTNVVPKINTMPRIMSYNLGIQHELKAGVLVDIGYVGNLARHLLQTSNLNQLPQGTLLNPPASTTNVNALRPYLGYGNISLRGFADTSNYNSLQLSVTRRAQRGLSFGLSYTFSKTLDSSSGSPQDAYNPRADHGISSINRTHVVNVNYIYELPFFQRHPNGLVRAVGAGWQVSGITGYQSGAPNSVTVPVDVARIGTGSTRATVIGSPNLSSGERTLARWFNTEAFLAPAQMVQGRFGNSGRNILTGPPFSQWDVTMAKIFPIHERARLQFRAESFNVLNHPSFTGINTTVRFDSAGKPTQGYGAVTSAGIGRVLEFGMKLIF
jgi:hypothetical protein